MILGKLLEEVYAACGLVVLRRAATNGSTTTVVDAGIINRRGDGYYAQGSNGGHILIISQTTDLAAPQGQFGEVSAFGLSASTPTFTVPTMTAAVGAGDIYTVIKPTIQLYEMIGRINEGLRRITEQERISTSLTTLTDTRVYSLPTGVTLSNILQIQIGNDTDGWEDAPGLDLDPNTGSTADKIVFTALPPVDSTTPANKTIKIRYRAAHPTLSVYSDSIEKSINDELAIAVCAEAAFELLMVKRPASFNDKSKMGQLQFIREKAAIARADHPVRMKPASHTPRINLGEM